MNLKFWCIFAAFIPFSMSKNLTNLRITNGNVAFPGESPRPVRLEINMNGKPIYCTGSLITKNYVLTAAHCVEGATFVLLIFGAYDLANINEPTYRVISKEIIIHEDFNNKTKENDIALIRLPEHSSQNREIYILALYYEAIEETQHPFISVNTGVEIYRNAWAKVSGWGLIRSWPIKIEANVLREAQRKIISTEQCKAAAKISNTDNNFVSNSNICIEGGGACIGDDGGPLTLGQTQIGIFSYTMGDLCEYNFPSVYTKVSAYIDWIRENTDLVIIN